MRALLPLLALCVFSTLALEAQPVHAQGWVEITDRSQVGRIRPVPAPRAPWSLDLIQSNVTVDLDDGIAQVHVEATFRNPHGRALEGTYFFPLPKDAQIDNFKAQLGDQVLTGEILTKAEAARVYEALVRRTVDPAILEYYQHGVFRARIFPVPAHSQVRVELNYSQVLKRSAGIYRFSYPLGTTALGNVQGSHVGLDLSLKMKLRTAEALRSVYSPSHPAAKIRRQSRSAEIELRGSPRGLTTKDFTLEYLTASNGLAGGVRTYRESGEDGYFFLRLAPGTEPLGERAPVQLVLVVDTSGSMATDDKIGKARDALRNAVGRLRAEDTFQIIAFSGRVQALFDLPQQATIANRKQASTFIDGLVARGATDIDSALTRAMADVRRSDHGTLVLVSDGAPTMGLTDPSAIVQSLVEKNRGDFRVHVFGVGHDVNTLLLDDLARKNGGSRTYLRGDENLEVAVSGLVDKVLLPCMTGIRLEGRDVEIHSLVPVGTRDLFFGDDLVLAGRYRETLAGARPALVVRGQTGRVSKTYTFAADFPRHGGHGEAASLWAQLRVLDLLDALRSAKRADRATLEKEIVDLGLRFGIVTPYTSYLVRESTGRELASGARDRLAAPETVARLAREKKALEKDTGEAAFDYARRQSERRKRGAKGAGLTLREDEEQLQQALGLKHQAGRVFHLRDDVLVDGAFNRGQIPQPDRTLAFGSDEYLRFLQENPQAASLLAVGRNVLFAWKGIVIRIIERSTEPPRDKPEVKNKRKGKKIYSG